MKDTLKGVVQQTIGGKMTLSGGTRSSVVTHRPWQPKLIFPDSPEECSLCLRKQKDERRVSSGWKTLRNSHTPYSYHRLLVPTMCWHETKLRYLGEFNLMSKAIALAIDEIRRTRGRFFPTWVYTHIGYGAGQNITHLHWHLCEAPTPPQPIDQVGVRDRGIRILGATSLDGYIAGVRAGQIILLPKEGTPIIEFLNSESGYFTDVTISIYNIIDLYNRKFNYPDYVLFLAINSPTEFYVRYTPILSNWGGSEFAALDHNTPFILPWPHEATAEFLRS